MKPQSLYRVGDMVGWKVKAIDSRTPVRLNFLLRENNGREIGKGMILVSGEASWSQKIKVPSMLYMELTSPEHSGTVALGAAISPEKIRNSEPRPNDFDAFWNRKLQELRKVPMNPVFTAKPPDRPGIEYGTIQMDHVNGTKVHGQMAMPSKPGKYPAFLMLQWASPPYRLWPDWISVRAQQGYIALNIQPHNVLPTEPQAYYDALPQELKNYNSIRQDDLERNYFVEMYLRGVRAVDYLAQHPNWDGKTIFVVGTSMGGQQALAVAGLHPKVTHVAAHVPAGADLNGPLHGRAGSYPFFNVQNPAVARVARYIDTVNFAPRVRAKTLMSIGYIDTACAPAGLWAFFNAVKAPKEVAALFDSPHNNLATEVQQIPFTYRYDRWIRDLAAGKEPRMRSDQGIRPVLPPNVR